MSNVIFMDGFDSYDSANTNTSSPGIHSKWIVPAASSLNFPSGRFGGQCIHIGDTIYGTTIQGFWTDNVYRQTLAVGFAYQVSSVALSESNGVFCQFLHDQAIQFGISGSNIGQLSLWRGTTQLALTAPNLIKQGDWHYIELEYVGNTTNGSANLYLDGILVLTYNGNTQAQSAYGSNGIEFIGRSGFVLDDLYVVDTSVRLGERRIETLRPDGDVSVSFTPSSGTSNFAMLNETLVSSNNFVSATTVGSQDILSFTNLSTIPTRIDAIQLNVWATKTDVATRQLAEIVVSGSTTVTGPNNNLPINHTDLSMILNTDPNTSASWTPTAVNAIQAGYKITL